MRDYDDITDFLGTWGPFQLTVFFALAASILPNGFVGLYIVFLGDTPSHECLIPEEYNISDMWREAAIPVVMQDGVLKRSSCSRYKMETVRNFSALNYTPNVEVNVSEIEVESCVNGWNYSKEVYESTTVAEWDLICENEYKGPLTSSIYFFGVLVGTFLSGQMSDRYGRRPVLFAMMAMQTVTILIQMFSPSWEIFTAIYFFVGFSGFSNYVVAYSHISLDQQAVKFSVFGSLGIFMGSGIGQMFFPLAAYFIRSWRWLVLTNALTGLLYLPLWWFIPESPRWLLSQGRIAEAEAILRRAAKQNKLTTPEVIFTASEIEEAAKMREKKHNILDILRNCNAVLTIMICSLLWYAHHDIQPVVRNMAMGTCSMTARIGSIVSPFIIYLGNYYKYIPYIVIGSLAVFSGLITLLLPETKGKVLPETIVQMQRIKGLRSSKKQDAMMWTADKSRSCMRDKSTS
ncbi:solute carrier family 22 member 4-like [Sinocyclocheilus anshuiensis]|uniref:solute carrier family 22 member 4-like n=1 Tax=Sinocyclocheilus anshuiensis TaxID=1608454 RepID=UPI0007B930B0|nr:PREDICTED: solute carrier family 22 member 4-like [Sinocyclocheilus anshuiensis]